MIKLAMALETVFFHLENTLYRASKLTGKIRSKLHHYYMDRCV